LVLRYISGKIGLLEVQKLNRSKKRPVWARFITLTGPFIVVGELSYYLGTIYLKMIAQMSLKRFGSQVFDNKSRKEGCILFSCM